MQLTLNEENKVTIGRSGCLPMLIRLCQSGDRERERYAVMALANTEMVEGERRGLCWTKGYLAACYLWGVQ